MVVVVVVVVRDENRYESMRRTCGGVNENTWGKKKEKEKKSTLTGQAPLHQHGDGGATLPAAKRGALPHATRDELERPRGEHLPRGGDADDTALAPSAVRALERRSHHLHVTGAVE